MFTTELEVLYAARESVDDSTINSNDSHKGTWCFGDWNRCTCGHIYAAAIGERAVRRESAPMDLKFPPQESLYERTLAKIAEANPEYAKALGDTEHYAKIVLAVSEATESYARMMIREDEDEDPDEARDANDADLREAALALIDRTIEYVEAEHEAARLQVLAQMESVVESAEVREPELV